MARNPVGNAEKKRQAERQNAKLLHSCKEGALGKVIVFGSLNMDASIEGTRCLSRARRQNLVTQPRWKGALIRLLLQLEWADVHMIGAVGADSFGQDLKRRLLRRQFGAGRAVWSSTGVAVLCA